MTIEPRAVLENHKALVIGVANDSSIAYGCAKAFRELGADLAITYLNEKAKPYVEPLARELEAPLFLPLDVSKAGELEAVFEAVTANMSSRPSLSKSKKGYAGAERFYNVVFLLVIAADKHVF